MKIVLWLGFLAFVLVQCKQDVDTSAAKRSVLPCVGTGADNPALQNLMGDGKPIQHKLTVTYECKVDMARRTSGDPKTGKRYDFDESCYVVGNSDLSVLVRSKNEIPIPGAEDCVTLLGFQAVFLPQDPDAITYMILKPEVAPRFFTATLSGCDVFVATSRSDRHNPIVIHSNLNSCGNKLKNLKLKGDLADQMLKAHPSYKMVARVYSEPGKDEQIPAKAYLEKYLLHHPGISLVSYDTRSPAQAWQFIGHFDKKWNFFVKGEIDGKLKRIIIL